MSDYHRRRTVNYANKSFDYEDDDLIEPIFSIDDKGRVICEEHTEISRIRSLSPILNQNRQYAREYEALLTCKKCNHFFEDDCYFPRSEINKIEADRRSNKIQCKLCGSRIDRPLTLMNKYYLESKSSNNLEIPVICCSCYNSLEKNTFTQNSGKRILFFLITLPIYIALIINIFQLFLISPIIFLFFLTSVFYWGYIAIRDIVSIYNLYKGRKYYNETFSQNFQEEPDD